MESTKWRSMGIHEAHTAAVFGVQRGEREVISGTATQIDQKPIRQQLKPSIMETSPLQPGDAERGDFQGRLTSSGRMPSMGSRNRVRKIS